MPKPSMGEGTPTDGMMESLSRRAVGESVLPITFRHHGAKGHVKIAVTGAGMAVDGDCLPRLDVVTELWDVLVSALATGEIDLAPHTGPWEAARRRDEAIAALNVRLRKKPVS